TARGAGVDPEDPPLRWEASVSGGAWAEVEVLADHTGGFNYGPGTVELQCPPGCAVAAVGGESQRWLRCRIAETTRGGGRGASYSHPPEIYSISAVPIGALVPVEHAAREAEEHLGVSDGTPGQVFAVRQGPMLPLGEGETLEVRAPGSERWVEWSPVESFAAS